MNKTKLIYYCKEEGCNNEIHVHTALYGKGMCRFCAQKGKHHPMFGKKGKLCPNFKGDEAETRKKHYCIESNCNNEICYDNWKNGQGRCYSCANKGKNNAMFGKLGEDAPMFGVHRFGKEAPGYKDGKTLKKYYCIDCGEEIVWQTWCLGDKKCTSCARKGELNPMHGKKGKESPVYGKPVPHGKKIEYKGIWMRSSWEYLFAKYLDKNKIKWLYEPVAFELGSIDGKDGTYRPDFYLPELDKYIEIKGWWRGQGKVKFDAFIKKYSDIKIDLLMKKELKNLGVL